MTNVTDAGASAFAPRVPWRLAVLLSAALSLVCWLIAVWGLEGSAVAIEILQYGWAPLAATAVLLYLGLARRGRDANDGATSAPGPARIVTGVLVMAAFAMHARAFAPPSGPVIAFLAWIHLPVLSWLVLGVLVLGRASDARERFAAIIKSIEALVTAAIYGAAAAIFAVLTRTLFGALGVSVPERVGWWFIAGLPGLIPVLAVASVYDAARCPSAQPLGHGMTRVFFLVARFFLALTLAVLAVYVLTIPSHFLRPFQSRETLIVFNAMLFAVMLLLVCATPLTRGDLAAGAEAWLRRGIVAVAALTLVIGLYALSAVVYRAVQGGLTANRFTVIGWNVVNIGVLALLLAKQARARRDGWVHALHQAFGTGLLGYALWTVFVVVVVPLIARAAGWPVQDPRTWTR